MCCLFPNKPLVIIIVVSTFILSHSFAQINLQLDFIGDVRYSAYNFTDAVIPYCGVDVWSESKLTLWIDKGKKLAPYLSLMGSYMYFPLEENREIRNLFGWQRFVQGAAGIQYYPFYQDGDDYSPLFGIRLFGLAAIRGYENQLNSNSAENVPYTNFVKYDFHLGADYYYDNIFDDSLLISLITWTNFAYRNTSFRIKAFDSFLWTGNVKAGIKPKLTKKSITIIYGVADFTVVPFCSDCAWWANYIHVGGGVRFYPWALKNGDKGELKPNAAFLRRFHIYGEYLSAGKWLEKQPPERTEKYDIRFGIGFSSPGLLRKKQQEQNLIR